MSAVKQRVSETDRHPASEFEGEIREFIRRDVTLDGTSFSPRVSATEEAGVCACATELKTIANAVATRMDRIMR